MNENEATKYQNLQDPAKVELGRKFITVKACIKKKDSKSKLNLLS